MGLSTFVENWIDFLEALIHPAILFFVALQRYVATGVTAGAVKM